MQGLNRNLRAGVATTFLFMATLGTLLYFLTGYFQTVLGYTALETGIAFLAPMCAAGIALTILVALTSQR